MTWDYRLARVVQVRDGPAFTTLADARAYILKLPQGVQQYQAWQSAAAALLIAAEDESRIGDATDAIERALFLDGFSGYQMAQSRSDAVGAWCL